MAVVNLPKNPWTQDGDLGIKDAEVLEAKTEIANYKTKVIEQISTIKSELDYSNAFFGEHQAAVQVYVNKMMDALSEVLVQIDNFSTSIDTAVANYKAKDAGLKAALEGVEVSSNTNGNA